MFSQKFFKLFPPPKFLNTPYAGLDISDDAVRCIEYKRESYGLSISKYGEKLLSPGIVDGGEIKDEQKLKEAISSLAEEQKLSFVKVSLPEERMYLFKTAIPSTDEREVRQNIEFKLEENVPVSSKEAIFFFNIIPNKTENEEMFASVSVAPRSVIMSYLNLFNSIGLTVISFEAGAKAIARTFSLRGSIGTDMLVHIMNKKTGIYVVHGGAVCFTSTVPWGSETHDKNLLDFGELKKHIEQVYSYWLDHDKSMKIERIIFSGKGALADGLISHCSPSTLSSEKIKVEIGKVWQNAFTPEKYIQPIPYEESLNYAVVAGLAFPKII